MEEGRDVDLSKRLASKAFYIYLLYQSIFCQETKKAEIARHDAGWMRLSYFWI